MLAQAPSPAASGARLAGIARTGKRRRGAATRFRVSGGGAQTPAGMADLRIRCKVFTKAERPVTLGLFLLVINAMMLLLVAALVRGFTISGFWTAFFASIFIAVLNLALGALLPGSETSWYRIPHTQGSTIWL